MTKRKKKDQAGGLLRRPPDPPAPAAGARRAAEAALRRLEALETLEQAYDAWLELRREHAAFCDRAAQERRRLIEQGSFLVGAVRAASGGEPPPEDEAGALTRSGDDPLQGYLREAEQKLEAARSKLEAELAEEEQLFAQAFGAIRKETLGRVGRMHAQVKPKVRVLLRPLGASRTILHVERLRPDEAILLMYALAGRIPSRYSYLFDDSTGDVQKAPEPLYADEGLRKEQLRPDPDTLRAVIEERTEVLPAKGFIPVFVPGAAKDDVALYRLLSRGPVMEVELLDGGQFRSILSREEGERFAGHLLRLKLAQQIELELTAE